MLDLSLARSYLPVCLCVAKMGTLCGLHSCLRLSGMAPFNVHVLLVVLLALDRCSSREFIFNTNTLTGFVFFSLVFNEGSSLPAALVDTRKSILGFALDVMWGALAIACLLRVQDRLTVFRYVHFPPLALTGLFVIIHSFVKHPPEADAWTLLRVFDFGALSLVWIYFVNVENVSASTVYDCVHCFLLFGHVLFTSLPVTAVGTGLSCVLLAYLRVPLASRPPAADVEKHSPSDPGGEDSGDSVHGVPYDAERAYHTNNTHHTSGTYRPESPGVPPAEPDEAQLHLLFREAKARMAAGEPCGPRLRIPA